MLAYIVRRVGYGILVVFGVLFLLYALFFQIATPDDIARKAVGEKAPAAVVEQWKKNHGYDQPPWPGPGHWKENLFVEHFRRMLTFDFGRSDADNAPILERVKAGMGPSLSLTVPLFIIGILLEIVLSLFVALFRETYIDRVGVFLCVLGMSISVLLFIIGGQYLIGKSLRWFPISGFDPSPDVIARFLMLPIVVNLLHALGGQVRFYRTVFVEEIHRDYVRTARAKGAGDGRVMFQHVLRNAMIPILTTVVMSIPFLFTGALLTEAFFGIPGLGSITVDAILGNDFSTLRTMVYIGALLFIGGQILTDISYSIADPRVRLE